MSATEPKPAKASATKIYAALIKANKLIGAIAKDSENTTQRFKFRGIDEVYNELHPILAECGIVIIPEVVSYDITERPTKNGAALYTRATIRHHFTAEDGSSVSTTVVGEAMDSGDKGMNKAMSIALKYALFQLFTIPTREDKDPDASSHELVQQAAPVAAATAHGYGEKVEEAKKSLQAAKCREDLIQAFNALTKEMREDRNVVAESQRIAAFFTKQ